jgi:phosphate transport system substrate-binding protein
VSRSLWAIVMVVAWLDCTATSAPEEIHGAGATFPTPAYAAWARSYALVSGVRVIYDAVGSGAGIERIRARAVDFAASDAPLDARELSADGLVQFPVVVGGVVPVINITGIEPGQLKLTGGLLARIYLGTIRRWNDPAIAALNPSLRLPNANITVVHRSDRSGTSLLWSDYLSRSSALWQSTIGTSVEPRWPIGVGGEGNEGVASYVQRTRFALGYVQYAFAMAHHLSDVALINHSGRLVRADRETFRAASEVAPNWDTVGIMQQMATDLPGNDTWPITGASFILMERSPKRSANALAALRFFQWVLQQGPPITHDLGYVPIPSRARAQLPAVWRSITDASGKPIWPDNAPGAQPKPSH